MDNSENKTIILFDGICNLCNSSVNFIINHDKKEQFIFASLQSDAAKDILLQFSQEKVKFDSILLVQNSKLFDKSNAILLIFNSLGGLYKLLYGFIILPKPWRDYLYEYIAKNRYKWFGKRESCMLPTEELRNRFL